MITIESHPGDAVDRSSEDSFPASDPPSWLPVNGSVAGEAVASVRRERAGGGRTGDSHRP